MDTSTTKAINEILAGAEASIRDLISKSAASNRYGDVVALAELAMRISAMQVAASLDADDRASGNATDHPAIPKLVAVKSAAAKASKKNRYPIFITDTDRLLKKGWSKKNKAEYEHRAPKASVAVAYESIEALTQSKESFDVDSLIGLIEVGNQEVPAYQIYMVIGWLIDIGQLRKCGRNDYAKTTAKLRSFEECWSLSRRDERES